MNILIDLEGIACKDKSHIFSRPNTELVIPDGDLPMTIPAGTELKLAHIIACPVCHGKIYSIEVVEDWEIPAWLDDDAIDTLGGGQASKFLEGTGEPEQLALSISTEMEASQ